MFYSLKLKLFILIFSSLVVFILFFLLMLLVIFCGLQVLFSPNCRCIFSLLFFFKKLVFFSQCIFFLHGGGFSNLFPIFCVLFLPSFGVCHVFWFFFIDPHLFVEAILCFQWLFFVVAFYVHFLFCVLCFERIQKTLFLTTATLFLSDNGFCIYFGNFQTLSQRNAIYDFNASGFEGCREYLKTNNVFWKDIRNEI